MAKRAKVKRIYAPTCWTFNLYDTDGYCIGQSKEPREVPYECYLDAVNHKKVGDLLYAYASAPGTGHIVHKITQIDKTGVYGYVVENCIRELTAAEVY